MNVEPVVPGVTPIFSAPKSAAAAVPVVSTETAAALDIPIVRDAFVLPDGGARTIIPLNHAVEVVDTSETERYTRWPWKRKDPAVYAIPVTVADVASRVPPVPVPWYTVKIKVPATDVNKPPH